MWYAMNSYAKIVYTDHQILNHLQDHAIFSQDQQQLIILVDVYPVTLNAIETKWESQNSNAYKV